MSVAEDMHRRLVGLDRDGSYEAYQEAAAIRRQLGSIEAEEDAAFRRALPLALDPASKRLTPPDAVKDAMTKAEWFASMLLEERYEIVSYGLRATRRAGTRELYRYIENQDDGGSYGTEAAAFEADIDVAADLVDDGEDWVVPFDHSASSSRSSPSCEEESDASGCCASRGS